MRPAASRRVRGGSRRSRRRAVARREQAVQQRAAARHRLRVRLSELPRGLPRHPGRRRRAAPLTRRRYPPLVHTRLHRGAAWISSTLSRPSAGSWISPVWPSWSSAPWCPSRWRCGDSSRGSLPAGSEPLSVYRSYRQLLGRSILLGLELLVAADIIRTVAVTPTFESVGVLAIIVLIRTFLSFSLELEITGRWPWQKQPAGDAGGCAGGAGVTRDGYRSLARRRRNCPAGHHGPAVDGRGLPALAHSSARRGRRSCRPGWCRTSFDGSAWVGLIGFRMQGAGLGRGPAIPYFGSFNEINVRLYSREPDGTRGVVFLSLDASRLAVVLAARAAGIPYVWSRDRFRAANRADPSTGILGTPFPGRCAERLRGRSGVRRRSHRPAVRPPHGPVRPAHPFPRQDALRSEYPQPVAAVPGPGHGAGGSAHRGNGHHGVRSRPSRCCSPRASGRSLAGHG